MQQYLPFTVLKRKVNSVGLHLIQLQQYLPFTVLKLHKHCILCLHCGKVATVLTVYGIETSNVKVIDFSFRLQQYLPFTVLKRFKFSCWYCYSIIELQQYLPFTVLKPDRLRYCVDWLTSCNSTYRLRYAPKGARPQRRKATIRSAHLKYLNEVKVKRR